MAIIDEDTGIDKGTTVAKLLNVLGQLEADDELSCRDQANTGNIAIFRKGAHVGMIEIFDGDTDIVYWKDDGAC